MEDFEGDIEYLDEDAGIIEQCFTARENDQVIKVSQPYDSDATNASNLDDPDEPSLLVRASVARKRVTRSQTILSTSDVSVNRTKESKFGLNTPVSSKAPVKSKKRKRTTKKDNVEDDSPDYDPNKDISEQRNVKKRKSQTMKLHKEAVSNSKVAKIDASSLRIVNVTSQASPKVEPSKSVRKEQMPSSKTFLTNSNQLTQRNKLNIQIPDYDDPLCLPVKMVVRDLNDTEKLKNWNDLCLDHFQNTDILLKPDKGETKSSKKIIIFRNVRNENTGKVETTIWSKTSVENERKERKSEVFQSILPRYKDNTVMHYNLIPQHQKIEFSERTEVILTKEEDKDGEILVAYRPDETLSSVYKTDRKINGFLSKDDTSEAEEEPEKISLREMTNCRVCAPCYQLSWRGARQHKNEVKCVICLRTFATIFNLISHLKLHSHADVRKYRRVISKQLSQVMDYHYKCRICLQQLPSIKLLRQHLQSHRGTQKFLCDVGNHVTT